MENDSNVNNIDQTNTKTSEVVYNYEKDFYKGISGELRFKAEGLFKKAKEKGISIEDINIQPLKESSVEFPGIGCVELPAYVVKVKGKDIRSGQTMVDAKQIDYFNRYQSYMAEKIRNKNIVRDERGKIIRENNVPKIKKEIDLLLTDWEHFEIGKSLVTDKEFGMEKTITGACDRVIRKLMGENDWLYPDEARLLDEEYSNVQNMIVKEQESRKQAVTMGQKKATERQINYLKSKIRNSGIDPENNNAVKEIIRQSGFGETDIDQLSTGEMSRIIDGFNDVAPRVKEILEKQNFKKVNEKNADLN